MVARRNVLMLTSVALCALLIAQFQNCAPTSALPDQTPSVSGEVRVIDEFNKAEIQFVSEEVQVHDEAEQADISGLCHRTRNGAVLSWSVYASPGDPQPLLHGSSRCGSGRFSVLLPEMPGIVCGVNHLLVVEGEWGASTFTHILRRCQPLAAEEIETPLDSPVGTFCSLEYQPALDAAKPCVKVCYRNQMVVSEQSIARGQCSGLAAKLAAQ